MMRYDASRILLKQAATLGLGGIVACLLALSGCAEGEAKAGLGPNENAVTAVVVSVAQSSISVGQAVLVHAEGRTASGQPAPVGVTWSASGGSVVTLSDSVASFSAAAAGVYVVRGSAVASSAIVDSATITVVAATSPTVSVALAPGSASLVTGGVQSFSVVATRQDGSTYQPSVSWSATGGTVTSGGLYTAGGAAGTFRVIAVQQGSTLSDTAAIILTAPLLQAVILTPSSASLATGATQQFSVSGQWNNGATTAPAVTYSGTGGTISAGGLYTAGLTSGTFRVIATQQGGTLADTAAITLAVPVLQAVILTPSIASLATGATQQFSVSGQWSNGATTAPAVTYSATGGSISAGGVYTAGSTAGTFRVVATQQGGVLADTASATITSSPSGTACLAGVAGTYPNQPAGMARVFEHDFEAIPNGGNGAAGANWLVEDGAPLLSIVAEPTSPGVDGHCMRTRFPAGLSSGDAPVTMTVDMTDGGGARRTRQYFSLWFKIEGSNFENQAVGTKFGFFGYGDSDSGPLNQGFLILRGAGTQQSMSSMSLEFWQQAPGPVSDRTLERNVGSGNLVTVGAWHHLELVMIENAMGSSNGEFHMWVDEVKTHQYSNVVFRNSAYPLGFRGWKWNPTWGGIGGTKTRDDSVQFAHVYLSGN